MVLSVGGAVPGSICMEMDSAADAVEIDIPTDSVEKGPPAHVKTRSITPSNHTTSRNDGTVNTAFPSSKSVQRKTPQLIIKRGRPRLGVSGICRHGVVRTM